MSRAVLPNTLIAADAFEAMIESAIISTQDLWDLDGETFLRARGGTIETCDADYLDMGGAPCR